MADLTFAQELAVAAVSAAVPTFILVLGGRWVLNAHDVYRKRREQEIELTRFVRERQYESLQEVYAMFAEFMRLYRFINADHTDLSNKDVQVTIFEQCAVAESKVDAAILRIASEFTHNNREKLEEYLAHLRQSVQLWREVADGKRLPFWGSEQDDYRRFKDSFTRTSTYLASQVYQRLEPAEIAAEESQALLADVFSNKWENREFRA